MNENEMLKLHKYICEELRKKRIKLEKRQDEVAFDLNITASFLSRIETGKKPNSSFITYLVLCDYYGTNLDTIIRKARRKKRIDEQEEEGEDF